MKTLFAMMDPALPKKVGFQKPPITQADVMVAIEWLGVLQHVRRSGEEELDLPFDEVMRRIEGNGEALFRLVEPESEESVNAELASSVWIRPEVLPEMGPTALLPNRVILDQGASITHESGPSDKTATNGKKQYRLIPVVRPEDVPLAKE